MLCPGNQSIEHGQEGLAAQLIMFVCQRLFLAGIFQIEADTVFKDAQLGNGIGNADSFCQCFLFQNGSAHGFVQSIKGCAAGCQLREQVPWGIHNGIAEQPLVLRMLGEEYKPDTKILIRCNGFHIQCGRKRGGKLLKTRFSTVSASAAAWIISASRIRWKRRCSAAPLPPYPILFIWTLA